MRFLFLLFPFLSFLRADGVAPEQVHLSLAKDPASMVVTWVTFQSAGSEGKIGRDEDHLDTVVEGTQTKFDYNGSIRYVHRLTFTGLEPDTTFLGDKSAWSELFDFHTFPDGHAFPYRVCVFGDLGVFMGNSTPSLLAAARNKEFDLIVHIGDIAYDLHTNDGLVGDEFMRTLEPMIARIPYMVLYDHLKKQCSFDLGPIHWQGVSTEYYGFYYIYGMDSVHLQYDWLRRDFEAANENRGAVPWIINFMHRPFYCSNDNTDNCIAFENRLIRTGFLDMPGLEDLFTDAAVDMGFWGHEHSYERFFPYSNGVYYNDSDAYHNAQGPVWVVTGSAGCHSGHASFSENPLPWSAARSNDYGYSLLHVVNRTHLFFEQFSVEKNTTIDSFWLSKDPGPVRKWPGRKSVQGVSVSPLRERECHVKDLSCKAELMRSNMFI